MTRKYKFSIRPNRRKYDVGSRRGRFVILEVRRKTWLCQCDCGTIKEIDRSSHAKSCGCLNREVSTERILLARISGAVKQKELVTTHGYCSGGKNHPEYVSYLAARARCQNPKDWNYDQYGAQGVEFRFNSFEEWIEELGPRPEPKMDYSVDRINPFGHYEVGNVRWASKSLQKRNQRKSWLKKFSLDKTFSLPSCVV